MNDKSIDKLLGINTTGIINNKNAYFNHRYEPTPYLVLDRLIQSDIINKEDIVVDYGCGKGRVSLYLSDKIKCKSIGIEYNQDIFHNFMQNIESMDTNLVEGYCTKAEKYKVTDETIFYFFNPFSVEIFEAVMDQIMDSYYENKRKITLLLYYPNPDYMFYLLNSFNEIIFIDEIDCSDLFSKYDSREKILIFEINE